MSKIHITAIDNVVGDQKSLSVDNLKSKMHRCKLFWNTNDCGSFDEAMDNGVSGYVLKDSAISDIIECIKTVQTGNYYISPSLSNFLVNRRDKMKRLEANKPALSRLTKTELKILILVSEGKTSKQIGEEMFISPKTVDNHKSNISEKLELKGAHSLIKFAIENKSLL